MKTGGKKSSVSPSTALLNQRLGTSPAPRMLTPSEVELLRQSKREIAAASEEAVQKLVTEKRLDG